MKPSILYLLITVLCVSQLHAQTVSMSNPSPDAANLGCVTNIPVSLHTGAIKPTIDLFDYTENGFHLCANMSYSMSGARPDLRAGWVGRYWNLRAGGVITRIINGKPDEDINYGYLYHADKLNDLDWAKAYTDEVIKKYRDYFIDMGEHPDEAPDDFYFEANGISGHFFIGKNKEIHVVGQPNIKVEIDFNDRMGTLYYTDTFYRIRIITDDGTVYHYGGREDIIESSQAFLVDGETLPYANAWHLNKITLPNGREVAFEYTELYVDNSFSVSHIYFLSENEVLNFDLSTFSAKNIMRHCYLKSIESDNIKINFNISNFSTNLKNENWKKLDEITIYDKLQNRTVKRFSFNYLNDYLMTLQESGSDSSIVIPPYRFSYNDPIYFDTNEFVFGPKRDVWGYYKEDCNTHFPRTLVDDRGYRYFALAKQPSSRSTKTGILEAIEYPSGGIVEFEYELNDYSRYRYITSSINGLFMIDKAYGDADELKTTQLKNGEILEVTGTVEANVYFVDEGLTQEYSYFTRLTTGKYDRRFFFEQIGLQLPSDVMESYRFMISYKGLSNSMNEKCGGLRIKSIVYKENEDKIVKRADYVYTIGYRNGADLTTEQSSGILGCKPIFEYAFVKGGGNAIWSIPVNTAQLTDGSPVGYSEVTEIISDGQGVQQGYTIYFYSNFDRYPDLGPIYGFTNVAGDTGTRDSQAHKRGKLLRKEIHANDDRLAQSVDYYYKCMNADTVIALKTAVLPAVKSGIVTYLFGSFFVCNKYSVSNLLVKEQRSDYALTPTMKSVDQCIQYKYNEYNQLIEKDVESSDGNHLITRYKYPHDYIDVNSSDKNDIYIKMFDKHIIAPVIEETQYRAKHTANDDIASQFVDYQEYDGEPIYDVSYEYDKHGNITRLQRLGYTGEYLVRSLDDLTYRYDGNRLMAVEAADNDQYVSTFEDEVHEAEECSYDLNGNLVKDNNRNLQNIDYNYLNLPQQIYYGKQDAGKVISYTYATDGTKLKSLYATGTNDILSPIGTLDSNMDNDVVYSDSVVYCDNSLYVKERLDRILLPDGYIQVTYQTIRGRLVAFYKYYYLMKDHQGSARINISEEYLDNRPSEGCREAVSYYPFGKAMTGWTKWVNPFKEPYTYTGKKEETMHGLGWYDYGKRFYDPNYRLSFISIDPLCEKYYSISPYAYCANNPIRYVDLQGDSLILSGNALDIQAIASTYNLGLGGFYTTSADATGKMSISPVAGTDPNKMTAEQKAYYSALDKVISGTDGMTTINVANGTSVVIGDVNTSTIDIRDIQVLGNGADINQGSALLHETIEQYGVQIKGQTPTVAHLKASGVERMVTGSYVDPINRFLVSGQLSVPILDPATGNTLKTVIIYVNNSGNVIGIRR